MTMVVLLLFMVAVAGPSAFFGWWLRGWAAEHDRPLDPHHAARLALGCDLDGGAGP